VGVKPRNPDFQALARAFHCHAVRPASLAGLTQALKDAFKADRPTLIEVHESDSFLN
jgi:thiamine pyrophosphate-dependent acetolactate synthase large subunit-like protein